MSKTAMGKTKIKTDRQLPSFIMPLRSEPPSSPYFNKPSVEYTGRGNDLIFDGWAGRWFRSSSEDVVEGCHEIERRVNGSGTGEEDGEYANYDSLYEVWGIETTDQGMCHGWSPANDYVHPAFTFTWCGPGSKLYDKFQERVFLVEPAYDAFPYDYYQEV